MVEETYAPLVDQLQTATDQKDREEITLDFPGSQSLESPEKYLKWTLPDATTFRKDLFEVKLMTGLLGRGVVEKFSCLDDSFVWEGTSWEDEIPPRNQSNNHYQLIGDIILFITNNGLSSVDGYLFDKHQMLIEDDVAVFRWPIEEVL